MSDILKPLRELLAKRDAQIVQLAQELIEAHAKLETVKTSLLELLPAATEQEQENEALRNQVVELTAERDRLIAMCEESVRGWRESNSMLRAREAKP